MVAGGTLSDRDGGPPANRSVRLASSLHPGIASLASTVSTGQWPESHGVVQARQPHVDRLGYEIACPERGTSGSVWTAAACSGRHVAICNWPHGIPGPDLEGGGRLDVVGPRAIEGLVGKPPAICPPGAVEPASICASLRDHVQRSSNPGEIDHAEMSCIALECLVDQGPDLMLGWLSLPGEIDERRARVEGIRTRLGEAAGNEATFLVLEHPAVANSVFQQSLGSPSPVLHVLGPRNFRINGRPRVDLLSGLVSEATGIDAKASRYRVETPSGGMEKISAAGLPKPNRISTFDLKQFEFDRNREIGASLVARGLWAKAEPWLSSSIQTQHGKIDPAALVLLLIRIRRTRGDQEADRLLSSVKDRVPAALYALLEAWLAGRTGELEDAERRFVLGNLGTFLAEAILIDLRRRGILGKTATGSPED